MISLILFLFLPFLSFLFLICFLYERRLNENEIDTNGQNGNPEPELNDQIQNIND